MRIIKLKRGFTLIEIMVVLGFVAMLSALAVTSIVRNRMMANENMAIELIATLRTACVSYYASQVPNAFPQSLEDLTVPASNPPFLHLGLIDRVKLQKVHQGYFYAYARLPNNQGFTILARPSDYGHTGNRSFFMDRTSRIFVTSEDRAPNPATDPTL